MKTGIIYRFIYGILLLCCTGLQLTATAQNNNIWQLNNNTATTGQQVGQVGIGTNHPNAKLHVNGDLLIDSLIGQDTAWLAVTPSGKIIRIKNGNNPFNPGGPSNIPGNPSGKAACGFQAVNKPSQWHKGVGLLHPCPLNTKVGIGTDQPTEILEVSGNIRLRGNLLTDSNGVIATDSISTRVIKAGYNSLVIGGASQAGNDFITSTNNQISLGGTPNLANIAVGIGIANPLDRLHVQGNGGNTAIRVSSGQSEGRLVATTTNGIKEWQMRYRGRLALVQEDSNRINMVILPNGNIGIGTAMPTHQLDVAGTVRVCSLRVEASAWCDHVFEPDYPLMPLHELRQFIKTERHLPGIPSEEAVLAEGIDVADMNAWLLKKIEEQTLYMLNLEEKLTTLERRLAALEQ